MNSDQIANRISDLLRLSGFSEEHTVEELTDHYLTHIEEEVRRGVNSQQAVRETFQEIASLDMTHFHNSQKNNKWKWLSILFVIFLGTLLYLYTQNSTKPSFEVSSDIARNEVQRNVTKEISAPTGLPIDQSKLDITSDFGFRIHPKNQRKELHKGIDIRAKSGTPVLSTGKGIVLEAGYKQKPGKYVIIQHPGGYTTKYFHLSDFCVIAGEKIEKGKPIGKVGNSGLSFMPHLHYEVLKNEIPVNPKEFIKP